LCYSQNHYIPMFNQKQLFGQAQKKRKHQLSTL
jgi:hypothetical protein